MDFGSTFGGPECVFCDDKFNGFYFDTEIYESLQDEDRINYWMRKLRRVIPPVLAMSYENIPTAWYNSEYHKVRGILHERLGRLESLVYPVIERLRRMKPTNAEVKRL